jgi:hypothetical protein
MRFAFSAAVALIFYQRTARDGMPGCCQESPPNPATVLGIGFCGSGTVFARFSRRIGNRREEPICRNKPLEVNSFMSFMRGPAIFGLRTDRAV